MQHLLLLKKNLPDSTPPTGVVRISQAICRKMQVRPRDVVRIAAVHDEGSCIFREVWQTNNQESVLFIEMDYRSRQELGVTANYGRKVSLDLKKARRFLLNWNHPEHGLRVGCRLGVVGLIIGVISLAVAVITIFISQ